MTKNCCIKTTGQILETAADKQSHNKVYLGAVLELFWLYYVIFLSRLKLLSCHEIVEV